MKRSICILLATLTVLCLCGTLLSCNREKSIIGSWEYGEDGFSYTFEKDGTGCFQLGQQKNYFTYTLNSNELTLLYDTNTTTYNYTFELGDDNTLKLTDKNGLSTTYDRK